MFKVRAKMQFLVRQALRCMTSPVGGVFFFQDELMKTTERRREPVEESSSMAYSNHTAVGILIVRTIEQHHCHYH